MVDFNINIVVNTRGTVVGVQRVERQFNSLNRTAQRTGQLIQRALAFVGVGIGVREITRLSDTYTNLQNRLRLVTRDTDGLRQTQANLLDIANRTRTDFAAVALLYQRTSSAVANLGISAARVTNFVERLSQATVVSGASSIEATNAIRQLTQGLAAGELRGEEFRSVAEQLPFVLDIVSQSLNITRGEVRDLAFAGQLSAITLIEAFEDLGGSVQENFNRINVTIGQAFTVLQNQIVNFVGTANEASGVSSILADAILVVAENIDVLAGSLLVVVGLLGVQFAAFAIRSAITGVISLGVSLISTARSIRIFSTAVITNIALMDGVIAAWRTGESVTSLLARRSINLSVAYVRLRTTILAVQAASIRTFSSFANFRAAAVALATTLLTTLRGAFFGLITAVRSLTVAMLANPLLSAVSIALLLGVVVVVRQVGGAVAELVNRFLGLNATTATTNQQLAFTGQQMNQTAENTRGLARATDSATNEFVRMNTINVSTVEGLQSVAISAEEAAGRLDNLGSTSFTVSTQFGEAESAVRNLNGELIRMPQISAESAAALEQVVRQDIISGFGELRDTVGQAGAEMLQLGDNATMAAQRVDDAYTRMVAGADNMFLSVTRVNDGLRETATVANGAAAAASSFGAAASAAAAASSFGAAGGRDGGGSRGGAPRVVVQQQSRRLALANDFLRVFGSLPAGLSSGDASDEELQALFSRRIQARINRRSSAETFAARAQEERALAARLGLPGVSFLTREQRRQISGTPGFQSGGSFTIGGRGGIDRNVLSLNNRPIARVSRGEDVNITSRNGAIRGGQVVINQTIETADANSFRRSGPQIAQRLGNAIGRQVRRNS